jgi:hypothetical protein
VQQPPQQLPEHDQDQRDPGRRGQHRADDPALVAGVQVGGQLE